MSGWRDLRSLYAHLTRSFMRLVPCGMHTPQHTLIVVYVHTLLIPSLSISLSTQYPFIPLPLLLNPRGRVSFHKLIPLALVLAVGTTACVWYWLLSDNWSSGLGLSGGILGAYRTIEEGLGLSGGSNHEAKIIVIAVCFAASLCSCGSVSISLFTCLLLTLTRHLSLSHAALGSTRHPLRSAPVASPSGTARTHSP